MFIKDESVGPFQTAYDMEKKGFDVNSTKSEKENVPQTNLEIKENIGTSLSLTKQQIGTLKAKYGNQMAVILDIKKGQTYKLRQAPYPYLHHLKSMTTSDKEGVRDQIAMKYFSEFSDGREHTKKIVYSVLEVEQGTITYTFSSDLKGDLQSDILKKVQTDLKLSGSWNEGGKLSITIDKPTKLAFQGYTFPTKAVNFFLQKNRWPTKKEFENLP